ncbi:MAG: phosphatidate cytidylyltransferase [Chloroflexota bacterium]
MTAQEIIGLIVSYAYATGLLVIAEVLRRKIGVSAEITRKFVHIGAGMWVFGILLLFDRWQIGIIPFATFIIVNFVIYRYRLAASLHDNRNSPGTVYFAAVITLLFGLLWRPQDSVDFVPIAVAGVMALTWGDALAALVGRRFGQHIYRIGQSTRSVEGSLTLFIVACITIWGALQFLPDSSLAPAAEPLSATQIVLATFLGALAATIAEAVSPHGTDNLSVPLATAGTIWLISVVA